MSLFSSIQLGRQSLSVAEIGIRVAGNNIANADTPGYIREEAVLAPGQTVEAGKVRVGTGVRVAAVVQQIDRLLESRFRQATSDLQASQTRDQVYRQLEVFLRELTDEDLSTSFTRFFSAIQNALNQPENRALRKLAALEGQRVADDLGRLNQQVQQTRSDLNDQVAVAAGDINRLLQSIVDLNGRIVRAELGGAIDSDAGALRSQRYEALRQLAELLPVQVAEEKNGAVNVFYRGELLVFEGTAHPVKVEYAEDDRGLQVATVKVEQTGVTIAPETGKLAGLLDARDQILDGFLDDLDAFTKRFAFEFNQLHSSGQGLTGFQDVTSARQVESSTQPLDAVGLDDTPVNGSFQFIVRNRDSGIESRQTIHVTLNGFYDDTTLTSLAAAIDGVDGVSSSVVDGRLKITADDGATEFAFADDTSGVLAALGINHFFEGSTAGDLRVAAEVLDAPERLALSRGGVGRDSRNGERLAALFSTPGADGAPSLETEYATLVNDVSQASFVSKSVTDGLQTFQQTLEADRLARSGVNLDEEAVRLITLQRMYQASARFITTVSDLLETLVQL